MQGIRYAGLLDRIAVRIALNEPCLAPRAIERAYRVSSYARVNFRLRRNTVAGRQSASARRRLAGIPFSASN